MTVRTETSRVTGRGTSNEEGWKRLQHVRDIHDDIGQKGYHEISAGDIREITGLEPRLMCKFDSFQSLPRSLRENQPGYAVLPVRNGMYRVSSYRLYEDLSEDVRVPQRSKVRLAELRMDSVFATPGELKGEKDALRLAHWAGMFDDFTPGEKLQSVDMDRQRTGRFAFQVDYKPHNGGGCQLLPKTLTSRDKLV